PCKKCGESVCGTDLEDHIRDSCAHTIKSCRFCELELPRRELPAHEGYCGARTEQCPDCREWVMIKYRQLHRDSNHGFLRLDDDPVPVPTEPAKLPRVPRLSPPAATNGASTSAAASGTNGVLKNINVTQERPRTENSRPRPGTSSSSEPVAGGSRAPDARLPLKRTNDQPQINTNVSDAEKVKKELGMSRGAVKKRQAPQPPAPEPRRDRAYYSAMRRQQDEERARREQSAVNAAQGEA
ncbi:XIAP-associated factor 1-like, partial [Ostrinia furnacalis]|uniref:XIAP-associated factor 1-like n=1 Tax=Ostrinia furnacalis TaxID=93504 RepID=UPI00103915E8